VRCFYLTSPRDLADHLNYVRVRETYGEVKRIPPVAYNVYFKNFEEPSLTEGFDEVLLIDFIPDLRDDPKFEKMFLHWT